ncbi:MAG: hypothetical protein JWM68_1863, partial [Verrucomicrobiales bacterium]|nr:hypothetical protein [Verrucomicrobiales bacterium]
LEAKMGWFERHQSVLEAKMDGLGIDSAVFDTEMGRISAVRSLRKGLGKRCGTPKQDSLDL